MSETFFLTVQLLPGHWTCSDLYNVNSLGSITIRGAAGHGATWLDNHNPFSMQPAAHYLRVSRGNTGKVPYSATKEAQPVHGVESETLQFQVQHVNRLDMCPL